MWGRVFLEMVVIFCERDGSDCSDYSDGSDDRDNSDFSDFSDGLEAALYSSFCEPVACRHSIPSTMLSARLMLGTLMVSQPNASAAVT